MAKKKNVLKKVENITDKNQDQDCYKEVNEQIRKLILKDKNGLIADQFEVTSMKMALKILEEEETQNTTNIESYIRTQEKEVLAKDKANVLKDLKNTYQKFGKMIDIEKSLPRFKNANYSAKAKRLSNKDLSTYMMMDKIKNKSSRFNEMDMAVSWVANQVNQQYPAGSAKANLTLLSGRVYRQLGGKLKRSNKTLKKKVKTVHGKNK